MTGEVTALLYRLREGDRSALDRVVSELYAELRQIARRRLRGEWGTRALMTTELVHEAYLRLLGQRQLAVEDRAGFFAVAANTMRRVLVDAARTAQRKKRGGGQAGGRADIPLDEAAWFAGDNEAEEMLLLDQALERLGKIHPRGAQVVAHRYFAGLDLEESAALLGVSTKTVRRDWIAARAWLRKELLRGLA
ncbi:MAG TPA: ECF-type sigma factor [Thermoanaerobaculia bacterium]|jgi:RNA polymerase sigma factor (TIGR02999 family)|nr:ECF-type sigma factor [Thermoanaerobaculia bacterium]